MVDNTAAPAHTARLAIDRATALRLADSLTENLGEQGVVTAAFEEADGTWSLGVYFPEAPNKTALRALVALEAGAEAANALIFEQVEGKDWVAASLEGLAPVEAGRFFVHGRHDRSRLRANRIGIEIEAALAFGTGHHGTTRGCLLALDFIAKQKQTKMTPTPTLPLAGGGRRNRWQRHESFLPSKLGLARVSQLSAQVGQARLAKGGGSRWGSFKILDVGTGTGVLAIAAARALHRRVLASDIDPQAVKVARDNARMNAACSIEFVTAAGLGAHAFRVRGPFDLVMANILLDPLVRLARPMARLLAPGARVVLSGLLNKQAQTALMAYRAQGLVLERRIALEGWTTLVLRRR